VAASRERQREKIAEEDSVAAVDDRSKYVEKTNSKRGLVAIDEVPAAKRRN
jgi:hypothetical protein